MAKPNKTVGNWRRKHPFPTEPNPIHQAQAKETAKRLMYGGEKYYAGEWTYIQWGVYISTGEEPKKEKN